MGRAGLITERRAECPHCQAQIVRQRGAGPANAPGRCLVCGSRDAR